MQAQGSQPNAKEDTVLLCLASTMDSDLSQFGIDPTLSPEGENFAATGAILEADSRMALTGATGRELYIKVSMLYQTDKGKVLIWHGNTSDPVTSRTYSLELDSNGDLVAKQGNVSLQTIPFPFSTLDIQDVSIHWCTRTNPLSMGSGDALVSEIIAYAHLEDLWIDPVQFTHTIPSTDSDWTLYVGGFDDGGAWVSDTRQVVECRIGRAFHTTTEFGQDWCFSHTLVNRPQNFPLIPLYPDAGFGDENEYAGGANAAYTKRAAQTIASAVKYQPLLNEVYHDPMTYRSLGSVDSPQWMRPCPWGESDYMDITKLRVIVLPQVLPLRGASVPLLGWSSPSVDFAYPKLRVRVHVQSWTMAGMSVPIRIGCMIMSRPQSWTTAIDVGLAPPGYVFAHTKATLDVDHTSTGIGEWVDLGVISSDVVVSLTKSPWRDVIYAGLSWGIDPEQISGNDANARIKIKAWQIIPEWPAAWEEK